VLAMQYKKIQDAVDATMPEHLQPEPKPTPRPASARPPIPPSQRLLGVKASATILGMSGWTFRGAHKAGVASTSEARLRWT